MEDESENIVVEENVLQDAVEDIEAGLEENVEPQTAMNSSIPLNFVPGHVLQDAVEDVEKELEELKICEQVYCNKNSEPKPKKQKSNHLIYAPNFIFKHFIRNGQSRSRLFIFPTADKKLCYEYFYDFNREKYMCCGCNNKKRQTSATIEEDENGEDFVKCIRIDHICKLRPFNLDKWESDLIIKAPNFRQITEIIDGESKKFLLLFTSADKKKFFKFAWDHGQQIMYPTRSN
uniref:Uncharacterized protein n=1 Tax=Panagrolaimus superbus TaxID=310955 RepID=A0A914YY32_9BILA